MFKGHKVLSSRTSDPNDSWDRQTKLVHWPLGGVLMSQYAPALRSLGLLDPKAQELGTGGFGTAYRVQLRGRNSVVKLTRDPHEVLASWLLRGRETIHVVPIFGVWAMPAMQMFPHWSSWWVIHRGYLRPFTARDESLLETLFDFWSDDDNGLSVPKPGASGRSTREKWRDKLRHETDCSAIEVQRALSLLDDISKGIREMRAVHMDWSDIIPENLLRDPKSDSLRIADVGFGLPKRDMECDPPELTVESAVAHVEALKL